MPLSLEEHQIRFLKQLLMTNEVYFGITFIKLEFEAHPFVFHN